MAAVSGSTRSARPSRRRRLGREEREAEILTAASELFSRREASSITVDEIAEHAGVSRALVYEYFGDRANLIDVVRRRFVESFSALLDEAASTVGATPQVLLVEFVEVHLAFAATGLEAYRLALQDPSSGVDWLAEYFGNSAEARLIAASASACLTVFVEHWAGQREVSHERAAELIVAFLAGAFSALGPFGLRTPDGDDPTRVVPRLRPPASGGNR